MRLLIKLLEILSIIYSLQEN